LTGKIKAFVEKRLYDIEGYHPDIEIERHSIQKDHVHLIIIIPPKYSVSGVVGEIKPNTSREIRREFKEVREIYWRN
jgi:putative transposase